MKTKIFGLLLIIIIVFIVTGCKKGTLDDFYYSSYVEFVNDLTLLPPIKKDNQIEQNINRLEKNFEEFINSKDQNLLLGSNNDYASRLLFEYSRAGIDQADRENWKYINTEVITHKLSALDQIFEKKVTFDHKKNSNFIIITEIYFIDPDYHKPVLLKTSIGRYDYSNSKQSETENQTLWNCDFDVMIEECIDADPEKYQKHFEWLKMNPVQKEKETQKIFDSLEND